MSIPRIVSIHLVRNEERTIEWSLRNVAGFADDVIVADNGSVDRTAEVVRRLAEQDPRITIRPVATPAESHDLIRSLAGTDTWVFGVDGDEIYDRTGLAVLRKDLLDNRYAGSWRLTGNVLNCVRLDTGTGRAGGYLSPPCRNMTKLYNFAAIDAWEGPCPERLHEGTIRFREGFSDGNVMAYHKETSWEASVFRCLHLCFLPRSSVDRIDAAGRVLRANIIDLGRTTRWRKWWCRLTRQAIPALGKEASYMQGECVEKDIRVFLPEGGQPGVVFP